MSVCALMITFQCRIFYGALAILLRPEAVLEMVSWDLMLYAFTQIKSINIIALLKAF